MSVNTSETIEALKRASSIYGVEESILRRWSPRIFSDRQVYPEDLTRLFEAARWAASSYNEQPWRFLLGYKGDQTYNKIYGALITFNQLWAENVPIFVLSLAKKTLSANGSPNRYALYDTGAATAYLALQATTLGLHTHSIAGFDHERTRIAFSVPEQFEIGAVTAIGYLGDLDGLSEEKKAVELAPRKRKPLGDFVFSDRNHPKWD
jgi:nitroreductase